jgi:sortase A
LLKGPGHLEETMMPGMPGNFAVAGDRVLYGAPFLKLNDLETGDEMQVTTTYGGFTYRVTDKHITVPEDLSVLDSNGREVITLITCDPPWDTSQRIIIRADCVSASLL